MHHNHPWAAVQSRTLGSTKLRGHLSQEMSPTSRKDPPRRDTEKRQHRSAGALFAPPTARVKEGGLRLLTPTQTWRGSSST